MKKIKMVLFILLFLFFTPSIFAGCMCSGQYTVGEVTIGFSVYYESTGSCWDSKSIVEGSAVGTMAIQNSKAGTISVELFADPSVCM